MVIGRDFGAGLRIGACDSTAGGRVAGRTAGAANTICTGGGGGGSSRRDFCSTTVGQGVNREVIAASSPPP